MGITGVNLNLVRDTCWIRVMSLQVEMTVETLWGDEGTLKGHRRDTRHDVDMSRCPLKVVEELSLIHI